MPKWTKLCFRTKLDLTKKPGNLGQNRVFPFLAIWLQVDQKWPNVKLFKLENKVTKRLNLNFLRMAFALRMKTKLNKILTFVPVRIEKIELDLNSGEISVGLFAVKYEL